MSSKEPIVSSRHLVSKKAPEISEFEFALILAANAFDRWVVRCMAAAGIPDLSPLDVLVLHNVNHRDREKKLSEICFVLNIEDGHVINYALKKLRRLELVAGTKRGKEVFYATTDAGRRACATYGEIRESCLIDSLASVGLDPAEIGALASKMRALSGLYDQASRAASAM